MHFAIKTSGTKPFCMEQAYGPKVRRGQDGRYSWRSKRNRGNVRAWDVEFGKRFAAYAIIDDIGEARASRVIVAYA